ncbi:hypothetical protein QZH41_017581 [Actinostola sp. cb2023]|nr:hypothetical protein QZH41_017581 [Actinostola sp. cb2023]
MAKNRGQVSGSVCGRKISRASRNKMADRCESNAFYKCLSDLSTADFLETSKPRRKGPYYEVERVISRRKVKNEYEYFIKWKSYGTEVNTWETEANLNAEALRSYQFPQPSITRVCAGKETLYIGILEHLKSRSTTQTSHPRWDPTIPAGIPPSQPGSHHPSRDPTIPAGIPPSQPGLLDIPAGIPGSHHPSRDPTIPAGIPPSQPGLLDIPAGIPGSHHPSRDPTIPAGIPPSQPGLLDIPAGIPGSHHPSRDPTIPAGIPPSQPGSHHPSRDY